VTLYFLCIFIFKILAKFLTKNKIGTQVELLIIMKIIDNKYLISYEAFKISKQLKIMS